MLMPRRLVVDEQSRQLTGIFRNRRDPWARARCGRRRGSGEWIRDRCGNADGWEGRVGDLSWQYDDGDGYFGSGEVRRDG